MKSFFVSHLGWVRVRCASLRHDSKACTYCLSPYSFKALRSVDTIYKTNSKLSMRLLSAHSPMSHSAKGAIGPSVAHLCCAAGSGSLRSCQTYIY